MANIIPSYASMRTKGELLEELVRRMLDDSRSCAERSLKYAQLFTASRASILIQTSETYEILRSGQLKAYASWEALRRASFPMIAQFVGTTVIIAAGVALPIWAFLSVISAVLRPQRLLRLPPHC